MSPPSMKPKKIPTKSMASSPTRASRVQVFGRADVARRARIRPAPVARFGARCGLTIRHAASISAATTSSWPISTPVSDPNSSSAWRARGSCSSIGSRANAKPWISPKMSDHQTQIAAVVQLSGNHQVAKDERRQPRQQRRRQHAHPGHAERHHAQQQGTSACDGAAAPARDDDVRRADQGDRQCSHHVDQTGVGL